MDKFFSACKTTGFPAEGPSPGVISDMKKLLQKVAHINNDFDAEAHSG